MLLSRTASKGLNESSACSQVFTLLTDPKDAEKAKELVRDFNAHVELTYELAGTLTFELPTDDVNPSDVFQFMAKAGNQIKVTRIFFCRRCCAEDDSSLCLPFLLHGIIVWMSRRSRWTLKGSKLNK